MADVVFGEVHGGSGEGGGKRGELRVEGWKVKRLKGWKVEKFLVSGFWFQVSGSRFLVSGFWFQVSGFRFLVSGFRFLVPGFWLKRRVSGFRFLFFEERFRRGFCSSLFGR
jgi:hypothetical protein